MNMQHVLPVSKQLVALVLTHHRNHHAVAETLLCAHLRALPHLSNHCIILTVQFKFCCSLKLNTPEGELLLDYSKNLIDGELMQLLVRLVGVKASTIGRPSLFSPIWL